MPRVLEFFSQSLLLKFWNTDICMCHAGAWFSDSIDGQRHSVPGCYFCRANQFMLA